LLFHFYFSLFTSGGSAPAGPGNRRGVIGLLDTAVSPRAPPMTASTGLCDADIAGDIMGVYEDDDAADADRFMAFGVFGFGASNADDRVSFVAVGGGVDMDAGADLLAFGLFHTLVIAEKGQVQYICALVICCCCGGGGGG